MPASAPLVALFDLGAGQTHWDVPAAANGMEGYLACPQHLVMNRVGVTGIRTRGLDEGSCQHMLEDARTEMAELRAALDNG